MVQLFGVIFLWGIPALFVWSIVLSVVRTAKEPRTGQFSERTLTFIGAIYSYAVSSLASWFGLICLIFGIVGYTEDAIFGPTLFILFGAFMVYNFFPRYNMPE
ncbi:hypothetical protein [Ureibacillus sinduriensis]|uniref:Uncharacterized protein n=1 Tax=Ureibacillus sinduriensis BLB-1 = JCM 15800 TaxID=1384057 RepID=A0A0A3HV77_9BACL|nr:hypothetical protein [Ureibacillus sinduriensis]KGR75140.1 hypothetical protein CD33_12770 [Ureibacillus sinduriensis BLB-1 = JCM 15800]